MAAADLRGARASQKREGAVRKTASGQRKFDDVESGP